MKTRIISGLIMAPLLVVLYFGGWLLWAAAFLIAIMGTKEFCNAWETIDVKPSRSLCYVMTALLFLTAVPMELGREGAMQLSQELMMFWVFAAVALSFIYGWKIEERGTFDAVVTAATIVYIPFFTYHMVLIDRTAFPKLVWIVVIAAFGQDICAYFTGYFLGRHKMAPNLSPKKTVEGAVGGLLGSSVFAGLFGLAFMKEMAGLCFLLGLVGGAAGMAGDLTASMFKRKLGIKDYGTLIPGHGGIMDRFDSIIFVAPVIYYAMTFLVMAIGYTGGN